MTGGCGNELCSTSPISRQHIEGSCAACSKGGRSCFPLRASSPSPSSARCPHGSVAAVLGAAPAPFGLDRLLGSKTRTSPIARATSSWRDDRRPHHRAGLEARHRQGARSRHRRLEPRRRAGLGRGRRKDELYDGPRFARRQPAAVEAALAKRHLKGGTLSALRRLVELRRRPLAPHLRPNGATTATARRASCKSSTGLLRGLKLGNAGAHQVVEYPAADGSGEGGSPSSDRRRAADGGLGVCARARCDGPGSSVVELPTRRFLDRYADDWRVPFRRSPSARRWCGGRRFPFWRDADGASPELTRIGRPFAPDPACNSRPAVNCRATIRMKSSDNQDENADGADRREGEARP